MLARHAEKLPASVFIVAYLPRMSFAKRALRLILGNTPKAIRFVIHEYKLAVFIEKRAVYNSLHQQLFAAKALTHFFVFRKIFRRIIYDKTLFSVNSCAFFHSTRKRPGKEALQSIAVY